ncbi:MAG: hypothetical protein FWF44_08530 [Defluviitaleaceae bacterium]|nr:hypothetical protein [Defluviitaleaceae bacterium]
MMSGRLFRNAAAFAMCAVLFAGCAAKAPEAAPTPSPVPTDAAPLTVYVPAGQYGVADLPYTNQLVQGAGFNLEFKTYILGSYDAFLTQYDDNPGVYVTTPDIASQLVSAGETGDFYQQAATYAPLYLDMPIVAGDNSPGSLVWMPTSDMRGPNRPAVMVRNDIAQAYGKDIRTADDYKALLQWIQQNYPAESPSVATFLPYDEQSGMNWGYMALNLFLPENGYASLNMMLAETGGPATMLWQDGGGKVQPFYDIDASADALLELMDWKNQGLIDIRVQQFEATDGTLYPTVLFSYGDENSTHVLDRTQYTLYIFPQPGQDDATLNYMAAAKPGEDIGEYLRFMDWLGDFNNFRLFKYGVEGTDYTLDQNGFIKQTLTDYYNQDSNMFFFNRAQNYENIYDHSGFAESNLVDEEMGAASPVWPLSLQSRFDMAAQLSADSSYKAALNQASSLMAALLMKLYGQADAMTDANAYTEISNTFGQISQLPNIDDSMNLIADALK